MRGVPLGRFSICKCEARVSIEFGELGAADRIPADLCIDDGW